MTSAAQNSSRPPATTGELRADVEHAREGLADTVSQLAAKADIKSRAQLRAKDARARMQHQGRHAADESGGNRAALAATGAGALALAALGALVYRRRRNC